MTSPAPTLAQLDRDTAERAAEIAAFLDRRYGDQRGWACLGIIPGDPSIKDGAPGHTPLEQVWFKFPDERPDAIRWLTEQSETHGNIYASVCLFRHRKRSYTSALPSPWLWVDDADPNSFDFSEVIQTSANSHQGWIHVDQGLTAEQRRALIKRLRLHTGGDKSDKCSADAVHMARVPGGYNTKRCYHYPERWHPVAVDTYDGTVWSIAELDALLPQLQQRPQRDAAPLDDAFWQVVAHHLANVDSLLGCGRIAIIKLNTQAGEVLADDLSRWQTPDGKDDRSMAAYVLAYGLHLRGFPGEEIAAILFHKYQVWGTVRDKGSAWAQRDISERILPKIYDARPDVRTAPTHYRAATTSREIPYTPASRARSDRPQRLTADGLLAWYRQQAGESGVVMLTRTEIAASLCISVPTLDRLDKILRDTGKIDRITERAGGANYSYVIVHDDDSTPLAAVAVPDAAALATGEGVLSAAPTTALERETAVCNRSNTTLPPAAVAAPVAPSPAAIAAAERWLATLHPLRIAHMLGLADDTDALLADLEHRTPDDLDRAAVVVAVRHWSPPTAAPPAPPAEVVAVGPPVQLGAAPPTHGGERVLPPSIPTPPRSRRRGRFRDEWTPAHYAELAAVLDGIMPEALGPAVSLVSTA